MPRKARVEVEGGLYHVITRGNNRRRIFDQPADYDKFLSLIAVQKKKLPFFLYAYCLMPNHAHLLIERQADSIGRIMHRVLTGYSHYYNRRYGRIGHLLQGRHRSILCQSDRYLAELVRYIHLNPVRARIVDKAEEYPYSSHRAYLGQQPAGIVDVDPVLRHFGSKKKLAQESYLHFVEAGVKLGHQKKFYVAEETRILGSDEFVDAIIHRIGETKDIVKPFDARKKVKEFDADALFAAIEEVCCVSRQEICSSGKSTKAIAAKEMFVLAGRQLGGSFKLLSTITGMSRSAVSRRHEAAKLKVRSLTGPRSLFNVIVGNYERRRIAKSQA